MWTPLTLSLILASAAQAAIFPPDSQVKMLDAKAWKKAMKRNETSLVAFVAPWCGHCQRLAPELSKTALGLHPLVPTYAVDCDEEGNKRLCAEQNVKGFPTIKLFPRGGSLPPMLYEGERTASELFYYASRRVPNAPLKMNNPDDVLNWVSAPTPKSPGATLPRALLLTKDKKVPLLWKVLSNRYAGKLAFGVHRDRKGKTSAMMGLEVGGEKESKVLIYGVGKTDGEGVRYTGSNKLDPLRTFFDSIVKDPGLLETLLADQLAAAASSASDTDSAQQPLTPEEPLSPEEEEIARKQEAQRLALLHGGFADLVDFEDMLKKGGADFHGGGAGKSETLRFGTGKDGEVKVERTTSEGQGEEKVVPVIVEDVPTPEEAPVVDEEEIPVVDETLVTEPVAAKEKECDTPVDSAAGECPFEAPIAHEDEGKRVADEL